MRRTQIRKPTRKPKRVKNKSKRKIRRSRRMRGGMEPERILAKALVMALVGSIAVVGGQYVISSSLNQGIAGAIYTLLSTSAGSAATLMSRGVAPIATYVGRIGAESLHLLNLYAPTGIAIGTAKSAVDVLRRRGDAAGAAEAREPVFEEPAAGAGADGDVLVVDFAPQQPPSAFGDAPANAAIDVVDKFYAMAKIVGDSATVKVAQQKLQDIEDSIYYYLKELSAQHDHAGEAAAVAVDGAVVIASMGAAVAGAGAEAAKEAGGNFFQKLIDTMNGKGDKRKAFEDLSKELQVLIQNRARNPRVSMAVYSAESPDESPRVPPPGKSDITRRKTMLNAALGAATAMMPLKGEQPDGRVELVVERLARTSSNLNVENAASRLKDALVVELAEAELAKGGGPASTLQRSTSEKKMCSSLSGHKRGRDDVLPYPGKITRCASTEDCSIGDLSNFVSLSGAQEPFWGESSKCTEAAAGPRTEAAAGPDELDLSPAAAADPDDDMYN